MCLLWCAIVAVQSFQNHGENHDRQRERELQASKQLFLHAFPLLGPTENRSAIKKKCSALLVLHSYLSALTNKCSLWFWNGSLGAFVQIAFYTLPPHKGFHTNASCGVDHNYVTQNNEKLQLLHKKKKKKVLSCIVMYWSGTISQHRMHSNIQVRYPKFLLHVQHWI